MFVKAFFGRDFGKLMAAAEGGQDRDGPLLPEGKLLSGHENFSSFEKGPGRPADRSKASTGGAADLRARPPPEYGNVSRRAQVTVNLAGDVTLEAADDLLLGQALLGAPLDVGAGGRVSSSG